MIIIIKVKIKLFVEFFKTKIMKHFFFNTTKLTIVFALFGMTFFTNCEKDETEDLNNETLIEKGQGVFVINEGAFQNENSSLGYIDNVSGEVHNDLFYEINDRFLGDVFQSMKIINNNAYLVINNSGVIEITEPETVEHVATIEGFTSPRHILPVDETTAYVTDLFAGKIWIVDLSEHSIESEIEFPGGWSEAMMKTEHGVFVTAPNANKVYTIDPSTHTVTDSLEVFPQPNSMVTDKNGMVWVLSGGTWDGEVGGLTAINPGTFEISTEIQFAENSGSASDLTINPAGNKLYYIAGNIWEFSIEESQLQSEPFIESQGEVFYGLGICPLANDIYATDAMDFNQKGKVIKYSSQGVEIESFDAGIVPSGFLFY